MKKLHLITSLFLSSYLGACSVSPTDGYTSEPSKEDEKVGAQTLNLELLLLDSDHRPLGGVQVTSKTSQEECVGLTNDKGVTRLIINRKEAEPILFTFKKADFESSISVRSLPTNFSAAGLVFESPGPGKVTLSHFAVEGLYR